MKKEFEYKDNSFFMEVIFNTKVEKKLGGERFHTINVKHKQSPWTFSKEINDAYIKGGYQQVEDACKKHIDEDIPDNTTLVFASLGFE